MSNVLGVCVSEGLVSFQTLNCSALGIQIWVFIYLHVFAFESIYLFMLVK